MLGRLALIAVLVAGMPIAAAQKLAIHVTVAAHVTRDDVLVRALRDALDKALAARPRALPAGYSVDASIVRLEVAPVGASELEVRAEVRAILSDERGRMHVTTSARTVARGSARDRALLQKDAIVESAKQLAKRLASG